MASDGSSDRAKNEPDDDDRVTKSASDRAKKLPHRIKHVFGEATTLQEGAHQGEKRDRQQQFIGQNAKDIERQGSHE